MATRCEDFPCCGHEAGDCDGSLYGSDESIKAGVQRAWDTGHGYCDHEYGIFNCEDFEDDEDEWDEDEDEDEEGAPDDFLAYMDDLRGGIYDD